MSALGWNLTYWQLWIKIRNCRRAEWSGGSLIMAHSHTRSMGAQGWYSAPPTYRNCHQRLASAISELIKRHDLQMKLIVSIQLLVRARSPRNVEFLWAGNTRISINVSRHRGQSPLGAFYCTNGSGGVKMNFPCPAWFWKAAWMQLENLWKYEFVCPRFQCQADNPVTITLLAPREKLSRPVCAREGDTQSL